MELGRPRPSRGSSPLELLAGLFLLIVPMRVAADPIPSAPADRVSAEDPASSNEPGRGRTPPADLQWSTTDAPRTIRLRDGTSITLGSNSRVSQLPMVAVPLGIKDAAARVFCLELEAGTLEVDIDPTKRPIYGVLIHAPRKVTAIVKTGSATVTTSALGTTVAARSGRDMSVSVAERWRPLRIGRSFSVNATDIGGRQKLLPSAPVIQIDRPVVLAVHAEVPLQQLKWTRIPEARGYWVRIYPEGESASTPLRRLRVDKTELALEGLAPGRYRASVSAIDEHELESAESSAVDIRVLAASLPPGAYATANVIYLPPNARIALQMAGDLEMTYGSDNALFVAAPETIGLHDGKAVRVRLRERGSKFETRLQLEPLGIDPRISIEPDRAIWPGPAVNIVVDLRRSDGTMPPNATSISAAVTVNAKPLDVSWKRSNGILRAEVEKPPFPGPWVVRIVVQDPHGQVLARDFLEVAVEPPSALDLARLF